MIILVSNITYNKNSADYMYKAKKAYLVVDCFLGNFQNIEYVAIFYKT